MTSCFIRYLRILRHWASFLKRRSLYPVHIFIKFIVYFYCAAIAGNDAVDNSQPETCAFIRFFVEKYGSKIRPMVVRSMSWPLSSTGIRRFVLDAGADGVEHPEDGPGATFTDFCWNDMDAYYEASPGS